jgi:hypothetical protein
MLETRGVQFVNRLLIFDTRSLSTCVKNGPTLLQTSGSLYTMGPNFNIQAWRLAHLTRDLTKLLR